MTDSVDTSDREAKDPSEPHTVSERAIGDVIERWLVDTSAGRAVLNPDALAHDVLALAGVTVYDDTDDWSRDDRSRDPSAPIRLPVREMREEPVPQQASQSDVCVIEPYSSRACERDTKSCVTRHLSSQPAQAEAPSRNDSLKTGPAWEAFNAVYDQLVGREITIREIAWRCYRAALARGEKP